MTEIADSIDDDRWLTTAETLRRVEQVMGEFPARQAICARAFDGLIRARADRFVKHRETLDDVELPSEFWWAKGNAALKQNWVSGDFSTWINQLWDWKAYGVRFHADDIRKMLPVVPRVSAFASMVTAGEAVRRLSEACGDREEAARSLFRYGRVGAISTSVRFLRREDEDGEATVENGVLLQVDDWRGIEQPTSAEMISGNLTGSYRDPLHRCTYTVELIGLRFDPDELDRVAASIPLSDPRRPDGPRGIRGAGRPKAEWWDDLLIEMFRRLWEDNWTPRTKAEVVEAMHGWLSKNPGDDPAKPREASDTALKARAKKLFDVLELGQKLP